MTIAAVRRRALVVTAGAFALTLGLAAPALAHVTVQPGTAEKGSWTKIAFRVPTEREDASTTKLEVTFPTDHPLPFVSVKPVPGWDAKVVRGKLPKPVVDDDGDEITESVLKIVWSGGKIKPGEFQEFEASVGPLPKSVDRLVFPAVQTYSSGEVVKWTDVPSPGGEEPEHPAPTLELVAAGGDGEQGAAAQPAAATSAPSSSGPTVAAQSDGAAAGSGGSDTTARVIGGVGLLAGLAGVGVGAASLRRRRA